MPFERIEDNDAPAGFRLELNNDVPGNAHVDVVPTTLDLPDVAEKLIGSLVFVVNNSGLYVATSTVDPKLADAWTRVT